jgi:hypothetical protein
MGMYLGGFIRGTYRESKCGKSPIFIFTDIFLPQGIPFPKRRLINLNNFNSRFL